MTERAPAPPDRSHVALQGNERRIGVHLHLHYPDLWPEMRAALHCFPPGTAFFVTTTQPGDGLPQSIREAFPGAHIKQVENRGRDIAPFLDLLASGAFDGCAYVCKLHGKKSAATGKESYFGRAWRRRCLADLTGSREQIGRIIALFESDALIGVIGPGALRQPNARISAADALARNRAAIQALLGRLPGPSRRVGVDFFAGSMFWFRPEALALARALAIAPGEFPAEPIPHDGSLVHALERLIPTLATLAGYRIENAPTPHDRPMIQSATVRGMAANTVES